MTTSPIISYPYSPTYRERINVGILAYMRERHRGRAYSVVIDEFERSGISQAILAARLGKAPEVISRWLSTPGNWTLDTESDLLFGISGSEPACGVNHPLANSQSGIVDPHRSTTPIASPATPAPLQYEGKILDAIPYHDDAAGRIVYYVWFDVSQPPAQVSMRG
jgi:hypothetical protein